MKPAMLYLQHCKCLHIYILLGANSPSYYRESISILSVGLSFVVALPSAFIVLPSVSVEALKPIGRLRIVAAGPFHNLVFWILLVAGSWMGIGRVGWGLMGYEDVTGLGRVVVGLESVSGFEVLGVRLN